jgi:hypothetical protein
MAENGRMGITNLADNELADLEMETVPEDVPAEIERLLNNYPLGFWFD